MGKPYAQELEKLSEVYDWATKTPIDNLSEFVKKSAKLPLYVIGSGGSFSATTFASLLHQQIGSMARCLTPLEFLEYENLDNNCSILIITASGNNTDILSSFDKAVESKPQNLGILCASTNNKLTRKASEIKNIFIHAEKLPTRKDGFLATNSLIATLVWLCRSYVVSNSLSFVLPRLNELAFQGNSQQKFEEDLISRLEKFSNKETIVCLYDNWGKTAAIDIESKLVEAGLANVQLADYRNFAHGRHNWLDKNREKTGLVALVNPHCQQIATKTLHLIPEYTPTTSLSTKFDGPIASLGLLIQSLFLVKFFGDVRNIDPGRPGVADFGRKIYHLPISKNNSVSITRFEELALRRKFGNVIGGVNTKFQIKSLKKFMDKISKVKFGAVIFDYDGTLCDPEHRFSGPSKEIGTMLTHLLKNNILVGVATGRGKSVRKDLQKIISKNLWSQLFIGYYNCSDIGNLGDEDSPKTDPPQDSNLLLLLNFLKEHKIISNKTKITHRPYQITIESENYDAMTLVDLIQKIDKTKYEKVHIVESSHSVDILSKDVSKLTLFKFLKEQISPKHEILCIGDRGQWPGNDFELLSTPFSLSVDITSISENTCWNLLPLNSNGELGTKYYLNSLNIAKEYFELDISKLRY